MNPSQKKKKKTKKEKGRGWQGNKVRHMQHQPERSIKTTCLGTRWGQTVAHSREAAVVNSLSLGPRARRKSDTAKQGKNVSLEDADNFCAQW